jgi:predicted nucleotidyltransferase
MRRKPKYTIDEIKEKIIPIAREYGVERVYLFGSYARGDAKSGSDIDFRVDKGKIRDYFTFIGMQYDVEKQFKVKVDLLPTCGFQKEFLEKIENEEVLLYDERT